MKKITIANEYLVNQQRRFALATVLLPSAGSVVALGLLWQVGITPVEIGLCVGMYALTITGITVGFHRLFSHSAFQTSNALKIVLAIAGSMAAQGPVIHWVSNHRRHHQYSDQTGDPHSPHLEGDGKFRWLRGLWHAQIGWLFTSEVTNSSLFAKDLLRDPVITKINQYYLVWLILGLLLPALIGAALLKTWIGFTSGFLWGGLLRVFLAHHFTWSVNSMMHLFGTSAFNTSDHSTNNIWFAIPTFGEAWHNNHHAFQSSAKFGLQWWQLDIGYWVIHLFEKVGLAWNVKIPTTAMIDARRKM
ncbi:acyl-CoA desaturase [Stenomitos frigidus]|uniref:Acyl-CoA desaturase n=1 Tax=Stenomitos frigidus ULC18 TaxID=2107698 RepID=A0A2T1DWZ2_9CYAN|nr:acyl-CoA desaturase [Stenomitos frigidus]PSB25005.1 acyl-CoA desaturase [Stenomitos frigidus ULC18]